MTYDDFRTSQPDAHAALLALGKCVDDVGLEKELTELVKLRVSHINGCAFCIQLHLNIARKLPVDETKLGLVAAWRDAGIFSEREMAALRWAELLTELACTSPGESDWEDLRAVFDEKEAVLLTVTVGAINNWNRIAAALRFPPPIPR
ncbi:carboxymuconolactone decarboxylase family protein [Altererythrobacter indicus]|uniref:Carboxymuconolactone decarboxylase family protein n=1 Tax=Altericroceibacterium indicum TaxID=374177 RepID=A0A845ABQ3_9SPHN|nr:carboxymuconolactone decarboxylase family protein [Altericroceibacterium indicum]MXP26937.1 carboxymuconolactone decarboxylase family protein [Altericroceibacterium indicum]